MTVFSRNLQNLLSVNNLRLAHGIFDAPRASSTWSDYIGGVIVTGGQSYYRLIQSVYVIRPSDTCVAEVTEVNITSGSILPVYGGSLLHDSVNREAILLGGQSYYQLSPNISNFTP